MRVKSTSPPARAVRRLSLLLKALRTLFFRLKS